MVKLLLFVFAGVLSGPCLAAEPVHFNPDSEPSRIEWSQVEKTLGPAPDVRGQRFGAVTKTQTNEYWRLMAAGYRKRAAVDGVKLDIQAAQTESDPIQQLAIMQNMIGGRYNGLLISPQSDSNLQAAIEDAVAAHLPVVNADGAVADSITHFVGPVNRAMGVEVAKWFIENYPAGGKVAVIEGLPGVFSTVQRSAGFRDTILATRKFDVVASVSGRWDREVSYAAALALLRQTPDLIGFYCNNDTMALGVVDAVKALDRLDHVRVFGTDGTHGAYVAIKAGELTGTVDMFPMLIGEIALDMVERLSVGQAIPRVVVTPQAVVTRANVDQYEVSEGRWPASFRGKPPTP